MGRNTALLEEIIEVLSLPHDALKKLANHYRNQYLVNAGGVQFVASSAEQLRLNITTEECSLVLDYIARKSVVGITVDHVETAINELLGEDRFIEPERLSRKKGCSDPFF